MNKKIDLNTALLINFDDLEADLQDAKVLLFRQVQELINDLIDSINQLKTDMEVYQNGYADKTYLDSEEWQKMKRDLHSKETSLTKLNGVSERLIDKIETLNTSIKEEKHGTPPDTEDPEPPTPTIRKGGLAR